VKTKPDAGTKIILLASVIALLIAITGFFSIDRTRRMKDSFVRLAEQNLPFSLTLSRILTLQTAQVEILAQARSALAAPPASPAPGPADRPGDLPQDAPLAADIAPYAIGVFLVLRILSVVEERRSAISQLKFMSIHDPLSGLYNRRHFLNQLEMAVAAAHRYEHALSLCLCDLDDFKQVNDTYGHRAGDEVIKQFGKVILQEIRADDFAGRYGGDEFCIALSHTSADTARDVLERIRSRLEGLAFRDDGGKYFQVSATFGVADLDKERPSRDVLIESADQALYRAKGAGQNCVG